jgi:hypothetical protein
VVDHIPALGARFDLKKIGTEQNCWQVFWRVIRPKQLAGASLFEGTIHQDDYCIAIQSVDQGMVDMVRSALESSPEFAEVSCVDPFIQGDDCIAVPLPRTGRIDFEGNLIGDDKRLAEHVTAPVESPQKQISLDVVDSASTSRYRPATPRTDDLPIIDGFEDFEALLRDRFVCRQSGFERDLWISPKELCDMVEKYEAVISVGMSEHSSDRSENALRVRLFPRDHSEDPPIELEGLYMFKSRYAVTQFLQSFLSTPKYADAIPDLAGIIGRFQLHFGQPRTADSRSREADYTGEERISAAELWPRLQRIRESFGDELNRAVDALTRRREADAANKADSMIREDGNEQIEPEVLILMPEVTEERKRQREEERLKREEENEKRRAEIELERATQEIRRSQARCIYCGKPLSFSEKLKKADRHKDCWEFSPE